MLWKWWTEHFWRTNLDHMKLASISGQFSPPYNSSTNNHQLFRDESYRWSVSSFDKLLIRFFATTHMTIRNWSFSSDYRQKLSFFRMLCLQVVSSTKFRERHKKFYTICVLCYDNSTDSIKSEAVDRGVCKKGVLKNFAKFTGKHL